MSYKPQRTFNGTQGNPSTDTMGPEQLSHDLDELCKMFNPNAVHDDGTEGGVNAENLNFNINDIDGVESTDIKSIRVKSNGDLEYTTDGTTYHPAFAREDNYLAKAGGTMTGNIAIGGNKVTGLGTPSADTDAAPKKYVDDTATEAVDGKIFEAVYGTTSYADVLSAYNAEKLIYATSSGIDGFIPLMMFDSANNRFLFSFNGQYSLSVFMLSQSNGWSIVSADVAPIASPNFTGAPTTPDLTSSSGGTQIANKNYVDAVIPSQSGQSGKFLKTNGSSVSWATVDALPSQSGNNGKFLTTNGSVASWATVSIPTGSSTSPAMDGTASAGSETTWAHGDHVHPTDTSRQAKITASGILKGDGVGGVTTAVSGTDYDVPELPSQSGQSGKFLKTNGTSVSWDNVSAVLPSQTGHSGEFLTTDGTDASWAAVDALPSQSGQNGKFLTTNGTTASWSDTPMIKGKDYVTAGRAEHSTLGTYATAEGHDTRAAGNSSHAEGVLTYTNGQGAHAEGQETEARSYASHAEGYNTIASNSGAHAEGNSTIASGQYAHAEGTTTTASANYAHAEGQSTTASGVSAHAEGNNTTASGTYSHAEGHYTTASGTNSHAEGNHTTANHNSQHVFGAYNVLDANASEATERGNYIEIVGNGTAIDARSNARTLDWSGNEVLAGKLTVGTAPSYNMDVTTKQYVDTAVSGVLPAQSGNSGKFLTTNGSAISWANAPNGVFWVTITATQSPQTYEWTISADKTVAEIKAAIAGGKLPVANIFDGAFNCVYPLTRYNDNFTLDYIDFLGVTADREVIRYSVTSGDVSGDRWYRNAISTSGTFIGTIATSYSQFNDELYSFKMVFLRDEDGVASTDTFYQLTKQDYGAKILYFTKVEGDNLYTISIDEHDVVTRTTTKIGIPPQTGQSGKFLTTDGTDVSWASVPSAPSASSTTPAMDGTAAAGTETAWAHGDHVHPTDTSRQAKITASGLLKGDGNGGITAAVAGTDYLTLATLPIYNGSVV